MSYLNPCLSCAQSFRYGMGCFAVFVGLLMAHGAAADESSGALGAYTDELFEADAPEPTESAARPVYLFWLLGASLGLGLGGFGFYRLIQRRRAPQYFQFEDVHYDDELLIDRLNAENALGVPRSIIRQGEPLSGSTRGAFDEFFNHPDPAANRVNLEALARTHLQGAEELDEPAHTAPGASLKHRRVLAEQALFAEHFGLDRLVCAGCDRRYSMEAQFCYHDGLPLQQDTTQLAQISTNFTVCKSCGWESDLGVEHPSSCPHKKETWTTIDVSEAAVVPMIPMMVCPKCGRFGAPGQLHCPVDHELMSPLLDTHSPELPLRGFGPRRKVCIECGEAHGPAARYCSEDGSELVARN